jgi:hypothetical protein
MYIAMADYASSDMPARKTAKKDLFGELKYIAASPSREHGGFHPRVVAAVNGALKVIAQLEKNCTQIYDVMKRAEAEAKFFQTIADSQAREIKRMHAALEQIAGNSDRDWQARWASIVAAKAISQNK